MTKLDQTDIPEFIQPYRVDDPEKFRLQDSDPANTGGFSADFKEDAAQMLDTGIEWLAQQQAMLAAQDRWSILIIFQARDAAGKDSTIKHVMSGLNPQGCRVHSFKQPHHEDLDHDYLWRYHRRMPARGEIGIFNRSYYEEVLIVQVHQELLQAQKLPADLIQPDIWAQRYTDINNFERYLTRNGIQVLKFFLDVSPEKQKERFLERLEQPEKHWKFSEADIVERRFWDDYSRAYEETIRATSTEYAPWYIIPADKKWFTRLLVAAVLVEKMRSLKLAFPQVKGKAKKALRQAGKYLEDL